MLRSVGKAVHAIITAAAALVTNIALFRKFLIESL
jgi:hypothetical protein